MVLDQLATAGAKETKLSDDTCAALACLTYKGELATLKTGLPTGWKYLEQAPGEKGYDAAALSHTKSKSLVIVNRGTEFPDSIDDIVQNVAAIVTREDYGQISASLKFLVEMWEKYASARIVEIKVIGHSLGGGLAEAQTFLGESAIRKAGGDPPVNLYGFGVGSAGYEGAIRDFAAEQGLELHSNTSDITHLIRDWDLTQTIALNRRIGSSKTIASIYQASQGKTPGPHGIPRWEPGANVLHNHDPFIYFLHRNTNGESEHVMWRWWKSADYDARLGKSPPPYADGSIPKKDL